MGSHSKQKGAKFERKCCEQLSLWITKGERRDCLWRSAMSGGRATVQRKKGGQNRQGGDISAVAPEGHVLTDKFYVECRAYKDLSLSGFVLHDNGTLYGFWVEVMSKAIQFGRKPMLIAQQNRIPPLVLVKSGTFFSNPTRIRFPEIAPRMLVYSGGERMSGIMTDVWLLSELVKLPFPY